PKHNERLLDVACGLGQEMRKLAFDGVDAKKLFGVDLSQGLIDAGFDLFRDAGTEGGGADMTFATGDIFADDTLAGLPEGKRTFDIIHVGHFFHLFRIPDQILVARKLISFLEDKPDVLLFGLNMGTVEAIEVKLGKDVEAKVYSHSPESFRALWEKVGEETGTRWSVEAELAETTEAGKRFASGERWFKGFEGGKYLKWSVRKA
ncbi:hypothetical protein P7C71_g6420, partial [Lecanoromycetidae sp. Uapishka_2]